MNGKDLSYLAGTADLARLEFASPRLTLRTEDGRLCAQYAGAYSSGARWIPRSKDVPQLNVDIDSDKFKSLATTFPADASIRLSHTGTSLSLRSRDNNHQLRCYQSSEPYRVSEECESVATCSVPTLLTEVELGADLNEQNKASRGPIGLSLSINKAKHYCRLMAFNGHSALFVSQIDCDDVAVDASLVVPAKDFVRGLQLFEAGTVELGLSQGRLVLHNDRAWFTCPTENSTWPNFAAMLKKTAATHIRFRSDQLKAAAQIARVLGAAGTLEIAGTDKGVVLRTATTEAGQFATAVEGTLQGSYFYGTDDILFASRLAPNELVLEIAPSAPTMVRHAKRLLVLMRKAA